MWKVPKLEFWYNSEFCWHWWWWENFSQVSSMLSVIWNHSLFLSCCDSMRDAHNSLYNVTHHHSETKQLVHYSMWSNTQVFSSQTCTKGHLYVSAYQLSILSTFVFQKAGHSWQVWHSYFNSQVSTLSYSVRAKQNKFEFNVNCIISKHVYAKYKQWNVTLECRKEGQHTGLGDGISFIAQCLFYCHKWLPQHILYVIHHHHYDILWKYQF